MRDNIRNDNSKSSVTIGLALVALLFGFLCALFGELVFPLYSAALAGLFLFDKNSKRILSVLLPIAVVLINVLLGSLVPSAVVFAIPTSLVLCYMYKRGMSKGECVGYMTTICSLMILVGAFAFAMLSVKEFSITRAVEYFAGVYDRLFEEVLKYFESVVVSNPGLNVQNDISAEMLKLLFDSLVFAIPSLVVCLGFALTGLTCKVFTFIISRVSDKPEIVVHWRFSTGNIFAYFYIAVFVLASLSGGTDVLGLALANIQNVFMIVYCYIGFNFVYHLISRNRSSLFAILLLVFAVIMFSSFAISVLSFAGVYFTIAKNKSNVIGTNK